MQRKPVFYFRAIYRRWHLKSICNELVTGPIFTLWTWPIFGSSLRVTKPKETTQERVYCIPEGSRKMRWSLRDPTWQCSYIPFGGVVWVICLGMKYYLPIPGSWKCPLFLAALAPPVNTRVIWVAGSYMGFMIYVPLSWSHHEPTSISWLCFMAHVSDF